LVWLSIALKRLLKEKENVDAIAAGTENDND